MSQKFYSEDFKRDAVALVESGKATYYRVRR